MIIYLLQDAEVCGTVWKAGTRLSCPDAAARKAIDSKVASADPPAASAVVEKPKEKTKAKG
jgi:hypothetical protein